MARRTTPETNLSPIKNLSKYEGFVQGFDMKPVHWLKTDFLYLGVHLIYSIIVVSSYLILVHSLVGVF